VTSARSKPITIRKAILNARQVLTGEGAALEVEVLLMHALGLDRTSLYQRFDDELTGDDSVAFTGLLSRRQNHEPLAYITGHREFFALDFEVTRAALIPRPETETLVELAISFARSQFADQPITIADIGTGSGIIAVSIATALPNAHIIATDVSPEALALARRNAESHGVSNRVDLREGDLLDPVDKPVDIIAANLPYVTTKQWETSPPEIRGHEPRLALDGGSDGLDVIRRLVAEASAHLADNGALFCEIGDWQGGVVRDRAMHAFPGARIDVHPDLAGRDRVLTVVRN